MAFGAALAAVLVLVALLPARGGSRSAPDGATMDAIRALDSNHNGRVEKVEVEAFAHSQGLSADDVRAEFRDLDTNNDGELETDEITKSLQPADGDVSSIGVNKMDALESVPLAKSEAKGPLRTHIVEKDLFSTPRVDAKSAVEKENLSIANVDAKPAVQVATAPSHSTSIVLEGFRPGKPDMFKVQASAKPETFNVYALELDAQQHAGKAIAEVYARTAAKALEAKSQDAAKATRLEEAAKSLRGQSHELKQRAATETLNAATEAAGAVLKEAAQKVKALEEEASKAEKEAKERRKQAREAMHSALQAQALVAIPESLLQASKIRALKSRYLD